nr:MAG TPA: hypothetical protein [Caudoviricetes sp.]
MLAPLHSLRAACGSRWGGPAKCQRQAASTQPRRHVVDPTITACPEFAALHN